MILAVAEKTAFNTWYFVLGGVLIVVLIVLGAIVVPWVRKRYHPSSADGQGGSGLDIAGLEQSRREGLITDEEFRRLRRIALGLDMTPAKAENSASSAPVGHDDEDTDTAPEPGSDPAADAQNEDTSQEES